MIPEAKDKLLFTPGPLTTSRTVKQAMLRDLGSRDYQFITTVKSIRNKLVELTDADPDKYTAIPLQGSGTYSLEAVVATSVPRNGKLLVIVNGAYGMRMAHISEVLGIDTVTLVFPEDQTPEMAAVEELLSNDPDITNVAVVHCETTTGIINPIKEIGRLTEQAQAKYIVDAMSSFGAVPTDLEQCNIDYLISSANKCIEGVPGFGFVLAKIESLKETRSSARSVSFDLLAQYEGLEKNGQFRFTPPTHTLLAFKQALIELEQEGGVAGRAKRYEENYRTLIEGMRSMGFKEYLKPEDQGYIITSFRYPKCPEFDFEEFYRRLNDMDYVIYPGKVSNADCFRIGNIGRIFKSDVTGLLAAISATLKEMNVSLTNAYVD